MHSLLSNKFSHYNKLYIGGEWVDGHSDQTIQFVNPYNQEVLDKVKGASTEDVDEAYKSAKKAQKEWAKGPYTIKRDMMLLAVNKFQDRKEEVIELLGKASGSTKNKAEEEYMMTLELIKECVSYPSRLAGEIKPSVVPGKENRLYRKPKGVIGIIAPWNYPLYLSARSIFPALALGNACVLKPATETAIIGGLFIAKLLEEIGLPKGLFNVVVGASKEIGDFFVTHPIPKMISFTGSTPVGKHIAELAGKMIKPTALELGGNNVCVVLEDADLDVACKAIIAGKFGHQGQVCIALNRLLVHESIHDQLVDKLTEKIKQLKSGNPADPNVVIGPIINRKQFDHIKELVEESLKLGAQYKMKGEFGAENNLIEPILLTNVNNSMPCAQQEIFGPVLPVIKFSNDSEALELANSTDYGLSGMMISRDIEYAVNLAKQIETGMIHINDESINDDPAAAFGGEKSSGLGRFGSQYILEELTTVQWISVQTQDRQYPILAGQKQK